MIFQLVHQTRAQTTHLLCSCNSQKYYFREFLGPKRAEHAPAKYMRTLSILPAHDYHGLVLSIHCQLHYIVPGHPRQLLGNNVFEFNQVAHALQCPKQKLIITSDTNSLVIADDYELEQTLLLFVLHTLVSLHETQASLGKVTINF
jgi:hypothetical protein